MTLLAMTVPDDPVELPRWLERRLLAPDFGRFVAELSAHFPNATAASSQQLLDRWLPVALEEGLGPLPPDALSHLLRHPAALAEFQERIVTDGGVYWDDVAGGSDDVIAAFDRGKRALDGLFAAKPPLAARKPPPKATPSERAKGGGGRGYMVWAFVSTGIAACLAVMYVNQLLQSLTAIPVPKDQIAWGWGKPSGLAPSQERAKGYLNELAANVEEWSQYPTDDAEKLGARIAEFRAGCTRLMHSGYGPLAPADKDWLLENCRAWAKKLDEHQQALDAGTAPPVVRAAVDETAKQIATTLREKAKQVG